MKEDELNHRLREIIDIASGTKTKKSNKTITKTGAKEPAMSVENKKQIARIANSLQELRLCIKYLLFDVEATRRERDKFKSMLDDHVPPPPD